MREQQEILVTKTLYVSESTKWPFAKLMFYVPYNLSISVDEDVFGSELNPENLALRNEENKWRNQVPLNSSF